MAEWVWRFDARNVRHLAKSEFHSMLQLLSRSNRKAHLGAISPTSDNGGGKLIMAVDNAGSFANRNGNDEDQKRLRIARIGNHIKNQRHCWVTPKGHYNPPDRCD